MIIYSNHSVWIRDKLIQTNYSTQVLADILQTTEAIKNSEVVEIAISTPAHIPTSLFLQADDGKYQRIWSMRELNTPIDMRFTNRISSSQLIYTNCDSQTGQEFIPGTHIRQECNDIIRAGDFEQIRC